MLTQRVPDWDWHWHRVVPEGRGHLGTGIAMETAITTTTEAEKAALAPPSASEQPQSHLLQPDSGLRRSRRLFLSGSKKRAQLLEYSALMQNDGTMEVQAKDRPECSRDGTDEGEVSSQNDSGILKKTVKSDSTALLYPSNSNKIECLGKNSPRQGRAKLGGLKERQQKNGNFDIENPYQFYPILPPNPNFFTCFGRLHITAVAKLLALSYAIFYGFLCFLSYKSDHAASFLIAVLVAVSVGITTLYGAFNWSKLCLIPFFVLQVMLVFYVLTCIVLLTIALASSANSYLQQELSTPLNGFLGLDTRVWISIILLGFILMLFVFCYTALLFWYEYQFIAEVDRFLKSIRKHSSQGNPSKEDAPIGGTAAIGNGVNGNNMTQY